MFKKYKPFFKGASINTLAYKSAIFMWFIISVIEVACTLFLWSAIYQNSLSEIINGYRFNDIIAYFVISNVMSFLCFSGGSLWFVADDIKGGTIVINMMKPISYRGMALAQTLGTAFTQFLMIGLPLFSISYLVFWLIGFIKVASFLSFLFAALSFLALLLLGIIINDGIDFMMGICCFYTNSAWGLNLGKNVIVSFLGGAALPLSFFKFGNIDFSKVIYYFPFAGIIQNPISALLCDYSRPEQFMHTIHLIGFSICWIALIELTNFLFFKQASKKITVQGG